MIGAWGHLVCRYWSPRQSLVLRNYACYDGSKERNEKALLIWMAAAATLPILIGAYLLYWPSVHFITRPARATGTKASIGSLGASVTNPPTPFQPCPSRNVPLRRSISHRNQSNMWYSRIHVFTYATFPNQDEWLQFGCQAARNYGITENPILDAVPPQSCR